MMIRIAAFKAALLFLALIASCTARRVKPLEVDSLPDTLPEDEEFWGARDLQLSMPDDICIDFQLSFEFFPEFQDGLIVPGSRVQAGAYIDDEYEEAFGILMSSTGGPEPYPRVFDSSNPSQKDLDLGTPNEDFGGPGIGAGGRERADGENSEPLGNVLIVQESNVGETGGSNEPNDRRGGGTITFDFMRTVRFVEAIGIMDIEPWDGRTYIVVNYKSGEFGGGEELMERIEVEGTGNNGVQTVPINLPYVRRLTVVFGTSGAITFVNFCADVVRVGFTEITNEGFGLAPSIVGTSETVAYTNYDAKDSKTSKHGRVRRQLKEADVPDSTKTARGRRLSTNKMSRHYTRGGQMNLST